ncbi:MAG: trypsin-like serine protease [Chloroflexi bacterium]|nr:trypsin-like serine protease [Chloroflexota bacterium]
MTERGAGAGGPQERRTVIEQVMHSVVQIVALRQGFLGQMQSVWTGSGTIVDQRGLILTNCHVADPRSMGMSAPAVDLLAVAVTGRSDEPPALTYRAQVVAKDPTLDLAVLRIVGGLDGRPVGELNLPAVSVGDSETLELGDGLSILGYPGIGGETVTFTRGTVSGFTSEKGVQERRAWIKTDATIAGGNSGGTAVNMAGALVGVPTQAAAGSNVTPVDARPVVDTNRDGRIDERDTPMAVGGFINGLRPVNLAKPLLQKAGWVVGAQAQPLPAAPAPAVSPATPPADTSAGPRFTTLVFSTQVTQDGRPINPASVLPSGGKQIIASVGFQGMRNGWAWGMVWALNGKPVVTQEGAWQDGPQGRKVIALQSSSGLADGRYHLVLTVSGQVVAEGEATVGRRVEDTDTEILGQVVDQTNGRSIADALVIVLRPDVRVSDFVQQQKAEMAFTSARTDKDGRFVFPQQLPKGQAYGVVVVARGYRDMAIEGALRVGADAPERAQLNPIGLLPD